ncbi:MAG TPA: hypothetical protein VMS37_20900 [Verrucomicrobiae bacterium]|nr:hypothetical protein [Verrucomicrobiae bacterium]
MDPRAQGGTTAALTALWEDRLDAARAVYEKAVSDLESAWHESTPATETGEISRTRRQALFREEEVREDYVRVLKTYADLVVHHIVPEG